MNPFCPKTGQILVNKPQTINSKTMNTKEEILNEVFRRNQGPLSDIYWKTTVLEAMEAYASEFNKPPVYGQFVNPTEDEVMLFICDAYNVFVETRDKFKLMDFILDKTPHRIITRTQSDGLGDSSGSEEEELPAVIKFLLGEGTLNGKWYGQTVAGTPFWWRKELRKLFESVEEVSRDGEPSTQGGEEQLDGLLKSQLRELAERRKRDYDRLSTSYNALDDQYRKELKRGQVLEEALRVCETTLSAFLPEAYATLNIVQQALNPKD